MDSSFFAFMAIVGIMFGTAFVFIFIMDRWG